MFKQITPLHRNILFVFIFWLLTMYFLLIGEAENEIMILWATLLPTGLLFYWFSYERLIPPAFERDSFKAYLTKAALVLLLSLLPLYLIMLRLSEGNGEMAIAFAFSNICFQFLIVTPVSWFMYKRHTRAAMEIKSLKTELKQSNASFDFLRSQINPHFLFNALNTIYATAIQENAERTSEGIEKLGDMMRFMLHENMQDKISLSREMDYLINYIGLQKLRTDTSPSVRIDAHIQHPLYHVSIAPMLLIPFVENAFKHGISLREESHIKVTVEIQDKTLFFDVYNSKHPKTEDDPEKNKSGIGLNNVKQRLQLLYPGKHELTIRETGKEFFVHLTLPLVD